MAGVESAAGPADRFFKFEGVDVRMQLEMEYGGSSSGSARRLEEKIEKLEQKLKIYHRKNKTDKVMAVMRQIETLKRALMGEEVDLNAASPPEGMGINSDTQQPQEQPQQQQQQRFIELSESEDEKAQVKPKGRSLQHPELLSMLLRDGVALPEMNAGESVILLLGLTCVRTTEWIPAEQSGSITFLLYETKDTEANRLIPVDITLVRIEGGSDGETTGVSGVSTSADVQVIGLPSPLQSQPSTQQQSRLALESLTQSPAKDGGSSSVSPRAPTTVVSAAPSRIALLAGDGAVAATFMGCPMAIVGNCVIQETCRFSILIMATRETSVVVLEPMRCCERGGGSNSGSSNASGGGSGNNNIGNASINSSGTATNGSFFSSLPYSSVTPSTLDAHFKFIPRNGVVRVHEPLCITVECTPSNVVPQRYFIPVRSLQQTGELKYMVVEIIPVMKEKVEGEQQPLLLDASPQELLLPDILLPCDETRLGVNSFVVHSRLTVPHALLVRANRPSLVGLFMDARCTTPLVNPIQRVLGHDKLRIYVRFHPCERTLRHVSRIITAGIIIEAIAAVPHAHTGSSTNHGGHCNSGHTSSMGSVVGSNTAISTTTAGIDMNNERCGGHYVVLAETTLRVAARIGSGELNVCESHMDLGSVAPHVRSAHAILHVTNPSDYFTLRARVSAGMTHTEIEAVDLTLVPGGVVGVPFTVQLTSPGLLQESLTVFNLSCKQKPVTVGVSVLRQDEAISAIVVGEEEVNKEEKEENKERRIARRGAGTEHLLPPQPLCRSISGGSAAAVQQSVVVVLPIAPVVLGEDGLFRLHTHVTSTALHVTNHSTCDVILVAKSDTSLFFGLPDTSAGMTGTSMLPSTLVAVPHLHAEDVAPPTNTAIGVAGATISHAYPRGRVRLEASHTEAVAWTLTAAPQLQREEMGRLLQHELVTVEATAQVYVAQITDEAVPYNYDTMLFQGKRALPAVGQCVLLPKFVLQFALSEGRSEPAQIDLGVVSIHKNTGSVDNGEDEGLQCTEGNTRATSAMGTTHSINSSTSRWLYGVGGNGRNHSSKSTPATIHLTNLSPILPLRLSIECEPTVRFTSNRLVIPPLQTATVEAFLELNLIRTQGPFRFAVFFVNELNPENDMVVYITGQYYLKGFELSCDGVMEDVRDSLSMAPLRVKDISAVTDADKSIPATPQILSESKIVVTATEPSVAEVCLRVTENPKLEGLIQLQALQYDAAASIQKFVFGPTKHATTNNANIPVSSGGSAGNSAHVNNNNNVSSNTNVNSSTGGKIAGATGINSGSVPTTALSNIGGVGISTTTATTTTTTTITTNTSSTTGAGSVGSAVNTTSTGGVLGVVGASTASTAATTVSKGASGMETIVPPIRQREQQSFRLRCVLLKEDLTALANAFFGQRKGKRIDICRERQALTLEKLSDIERRRGMSSPTMWLGTLFFSNALTGGEEEVQVFSTLSAFLTFTASSKLVLRPYRATIATSAGTGTPRLLSPPSPLASTSALVSSIVLLGQQVTVTTTPLSQLYVGELVISNPSVFHTVTLSVTAVKDRLYHDSLAIWCVSMDDVSSTVLSPSPQQQQHQQVSASAGIASACNRERVNPTLLPRENEDNGAMNTDTSLPMTTTTTTTSTNTNNNDTYSSSSRDLCTPSPNPTTAETTDSGEGTSLFLSIPPQCTQRVQVVLRVEMGRYPSNVEQAVALALFDESVPCSAAVVRMTLVPMDEVAQREEEQKKLVSRGSMQQMDSAPTRDNSKDGDKVAETATATATTAASPLFAAGGSGTGTGGELTATTTTTTMTTTTTNTNSNAATTGGGLMTVLIPHNTSHVSSTPTRVLTLHGNCQPVPDCSGAYASSFSFAKDAPPTTDITIRNNLTDSVVEYNVVVVSQGPQTWLLLPSSTAVLEPGETQPLRLNILPTGAGSFVGYVNIFNNATPSEMLLLQVNADVFVPTSGEGLFEILASDGQRIPANAERQVFVGRLFGDNSLRTYAAFEIVNRSSAPLEFPVAVVKPFRIEFNRVPSEDDTIGFIEPSVTTSDVTPNPTTASDVTLNKTDSSSDIVDIQARENSGGRLSLQATEGVGGAESRQQQQQYRSGGHGNIVDNRPLCEVRLLVCNLNSVPEMLGQKCFVVDPKSRVNVAFLLICDQLHLPSGLAACGEAAVVLKCKEARGARYVFRARFEVCRASMAVKRRVFFTAAQDYTQRIPIRNLRSREIRVTYRTSSPILDIVVGDREKPPTQQQQQQQQQQQDNSNTIGIGVGGSAVLSVRLSIERLAALHNWGSLGDMAGEVPTICEHLVLLNERNPSEHIRIELCHLPPTLSPVSDRQMCSKLSVAAPAASTAQSLVRAVKVGRSHISEDRLFNFVQRFWSVLSEASDILVSEFQYYTAPKGIELPASLRSMTSNNNNNSNNNSSNSNFYSTHGGMNSAVSCASCWKALHSLLVDLTWLVDELLHYSILLQNSRVIEAYGVFLTASITNHPFMRAWREHKKNLPSACIFAVFGQYLETIDALPCPTPSTD